jgi:7-cyano-7-deazaguanine reductase
VTLTLLGQQTPFPTEVSSKLLEAFDSPALGVGSLDVQIVMDHAEFTCLCPKTGQPDFGKIEITYSVRSKCVESKSLKLYLGSYRNARMFHEQLVTQVATHLVELLNPYNLTVTGHFNPRGGLAFKPTFYWEPNE